ncbi:thiamine diphosphokinase [Gracilibacillus salinarum]|uniref:Thiamine diphosphokinase n=1 Tax=Gracilibacillus salinarum TaxID=2932255 RepID=A0ABY4GMV3_9BACI|nr:thiamine diphosphokinase [Gracilibacillus salinarum]UOQ85531.1 thiamine diphosphokinase [Gracilibacillus salinarum]
MHIGIVAGGPEQTLSQLTTFQSTVDYWIGADKGALYIVRNELPLDMAIGDFDSITPDEKKLVQQYAARYQEYPSAKNETDLELAVSHALHLEPEAISIFGATGKRLDHEMANLQLLYLLLEKNIKAMLFDQDNAISIYKPGTYKIEANASELISFVPLSKHVEGLTLRDFAYPLEDYTLTWGSTRCISNKIIGSQGTFLFNDGILIMIKSTEEEPT